MATNKEIAKIESELNPLLERAKTLTIKSQKDMAVVTEELSKLNIMKDRATKQMETITLPAKETIKAAEAIWKPFINAAKEAIENLREKASDYQTAETLKAREEEAKIANRVKEGKGNLSFETAEKKMAGIDRPAEKVMTQSGSVSFVETEQFEVEDLSKVPLEYHVADEVKIRAAMKAGQKLPGIRYFMKMVPRNKR